MTLDASEFNWKTQLEMSSASNAPSAVLPDGSLNVSFLERDIAKDLQSHQQYRAEDEMKKRAIHASSNYDEFKAFVKCSRQNPVSKLEINQLFNGPITGVTPLQSNASSTAPKVDSSRSSIYQPTSFSSDRHATTNPTLPLTCCNDGQDKYSVDTFSQPQNAMDFERIWTKHTTIEKKSRFLSSDLTPKHFLKLYTNIELSSFLLGDIIECLAHIASSFDCSDEDCLRKVYSWMKIITKCNRFTINVLLLKAGQKDMVHFIVGEFLKQPSRNARPSISDKSLKKIEILYGIRTHND